jgi:uncharacterized membrane protein
MMATDGSGALLIALLMGLVTLGTRLGGVFITSFVPLRPRVRGFIDGMSGAVLVAVIVPVALESDLAGRLALLATAALMVAAGRPMPAIAAGIATAACLRAAGL